LIYRLGEVIGIALDNALLYNEVQLNNEKLKELDKLKDEFVSVASHELRTPMTAIMSYIWMALDGRGGPLTEKQKYYLERAYSSVNRLIKLVNEMLNVSRIESGRVTVSLGAVDLEKITQEVIDEVLPRANELGISVEEVHGDALPLVLADSDKIKEVLFNLLGNALKFTQKEGKITVSFFINGDMVETTVKDTGSGIAPGDLPKLFQKFGLLPDSYTMNQIAPNSGTGLGLYICKAIIELHHGKIWADSEGHGKGTAVTFSLKIKE
jgi:signal transduction histidine kinase